MAELASGAVNSLLGVIRNEALLLGRVRYDVQFIQEEMESMRSFLAHLAKKAPTAGREHGGEQIQTWMNQVRLLAQDSNNCIDLYLYRGNPEIHLASGGLRRYLAWLPWFLHKMVAQHRAAVQLRALRERARDIGERRLRYGVEVPAKGVATGQSPAATGTGLTPTAAEELPSMHAGTTSAISGDEEEEDSDVDQLVVAMSTTDHFVTRDTFLEFPRPEDNVREKLTEWIKNVAERDTAVGRESRPRPSVAIVAPDVKETRAIAHEASAMWKKHGTRRRGVLVDIPEVHFYFRALRTQDILFYILRELQKQQVEEEDPPHGVVENVPRRRTLTWHDNMLMHFGLLRRSESMKRKDAISKEKMKLLGDITNNIEGMGVKEKISEITSRVKAMKGSDLEQLNEDQLGLLESAKDQPLGVLLRALWLPTLKPREGMPATKQGQESKEVAHSQDDVIKETTKKLKELMEGSGWSKLKEHTKEGADEILKLKEPMGEKLKPQGQMEEEAPIKPIRLNEAQYEHIIREVFPVTIKKPLQIREQAPTGTVVLVDDQIKELISKVLHELQENRSLKHGGTAELQENKSVSSHDCIPDALIEETVKKIGKIHQKMIEQLKIKGTMDKINDCLKSQPADRILLILKLDNDYVSGWEETKNAFSMLECIAGALMLKTTENATQAREYCCPPREPIECSLLGLYRDIAFGLRKRQVTEDSNHILLDILHKCNQDEFCMKIFVHSLYANPKRSNEQLRKLQKTLQQVSDNSLNIIDKKLFKFSYSDMPKEYKSCLLYLAIFPPRRSIRRSTLIGRWVVEGLITKEDWARTVLRANQCFDALVDRWFVYPADIGATGEVKSCVVGDRVHGFITKIARKQRIVETRLSHHLARHFSIFNDLQLRGSDRIYNFFQKLHEESSRVSLIKVLDLEYCQCFGGKNQSYLKDICNKMLLLKYLSLRGTDVTNLPSEINNLRELEVLDIRETKVPAAATINLLLLKLKRLLAGSVVSSSGSESTEISYVMVPDKIQKMLNMEVLSNVKAQNHHDLKDIGKLWQLRKLGVVIEHEDKIIRNLLRAISDLHECLRSLSITLPMTEEDPSNENFTSDVLSYMEHSPKLLESLTIRGTTQTRQLLRLLTKDGAQPQLSNVTLSGTRLRQADLEVLAKLPKLVCVRLRHKAYIDSKLTFNKEQFKILKFFLIEGSNIFDISFENGAALKLEKIVLCSTDGLKSLSGVEGLPKLKEVELKNSPKLSLFDKAKNISKVTLCSTIMTQDDVEILAKIPKMRSLVLKEISYVQNQLIFYKDDFPWLNIIIVDFPLTTNMSFARGSAPKLEKIIWSFRNGTVDTLSGIDNLPKLKELEYNGDSVPGEVEEAIRRHKNKPILTHNKPEKF